MATANPAEPANPAVPAAGRIDVHSHLLPGIDDGCATLEDSLASIAMLLQRGYAGSICTPHMGAVGPDNTPRRIHTLVGQMRQVLRQHRVEYALWPGGELRLDPGVIPWMQRHGVPTLAGSRCVLFDLWERCWPTYAEEAVDWLLRQGYRPIYAHPERTPCTWLVPDLLTSLRDRGVLLQGNLRSLTGEEGPQAEMTARMLLNAGAYDLMALDLHGPDSLPARLAGLEVLVRDYGQATSDRLTIHAPREVIFEAPGGGG